MSLTLYTHTQRIAKLAPHAQPSPRGMRCCAACAAYATSRRIACRRRQSRAAYATSRPIPCKRHKAALQRGLGIRGLTRRKHCQNISVTSAMQHAAHERRKAQSDHSGPHGAPCLRSVKRCTKVCDSMDSRFLSGRSPATIILFWPNLQSNGENSRRTSGTRTAMRHVASSASLRIGLWHKLHVCRFVSISSQNSVGCPMIMALYYRISQSFGH